MLLRALLCLLMLVGWTSSAMAHPHVWVDYSVEAVSTKEGITKLKFRWHFDEMFTSMVTEDFGIKEITPKNTITLRDKAFANLKNYHYYTYMKLDGKEFDPTEISDFSAELKNRRLDYLFTITLPHPTQALELSLYDEEFYVDIGPPMMSPETESVGIMAKAVQKPKNFLSAAAEDGAPLPVCEYHDGQPRLSASWGKFAVFVVNCKAGEK